MFRYIFIGKVLPERVDFSLTPHGIEALTSTGSTFTINISIQKSQIFMEINSDIEINDISTLRNGMMDFVRMYTDIFGYLNGYGYGIEITSVILPNNEQIIFGVQIPELVQDSENRPVKDFQNILELCQKPENISLRLALTDLNLSILYPKDTGVFCYRSIESIMQFFNDGDPKNTEDRKRAWGLLNNNLRTSKQWIDYVSSFALNVRHGTITPLTSDQRVEVMKHAWKIIDRFILYLTNGRKPLDTTYPIL